MHHSIQECYLNTRDALVEAKRALLRIAEWCDDPNTDAVVACRYAWNVAKAALATASITEQGETAGLPSEKLLCEEIVKGVLVRRMPDDPACLRVSLGRALIPGGDGPYCVYRGDRRAVILLLEDALAAVKQW